LRSVGVGDATLKDAVVLFAHANNYAVVVFEDDAQGYLEVQH
jgi:hypothetical protein